MRDAFIRIFNEYGQSKLEDYAGHQFASYIRNDLPRLMESYSQDAPVVWEGSPGKGKWADAPWIGALNPLVTETPQDGYYPVYLFNNNLDSVYLSLNQGMTLLVNEFGVEQGRETLNHRAQIIRTRLAGEYEKTFNTEPIDLQPTSPTSRLALYQPGHVFGIRYDRDSLPDNQSLVSDLNEMLRLYVLAFAYGGTSEFDNPLIEGAYDEAPDLELEEKRRFRYHRVVERNARLTRQAKEIHGLTCMVCGFNFRDYYGDLGSGFIEAHHIVPLSELPFTGPVTLSARDDFRVVCANCHRMLHRRGGPNSFDEFLRIYQRREGE